MAVAVQRRSRGRRRAISRASDGVAPDLLADEEERRLHAGRGEQLEHGRRALRVRAVVERQRVAARRRPCGPRRRAGAAARAARRPGPGAGSRRRARRARTRAPLRRSGDSGCDDRGQTWSNWCWESRRPSAASTLYSLGIALQAMDAKEAPARRAPASGARLAACCAARAGCSAPASRSSAGRCSSSRCCWRRSWSSSRRSRPACSCCWSSPSACSASTPGAASTWRLSRS